MHIALIVDRSRLRLEREMLDRLATALADRVPLTCIVPESGAEREPDPTLRRAGMTFLEAPMPVMPFFRRARRAVLASTFEKDAPDVIFALGEHAWQLAMDLAPAIDAPVALELWCNRQVRAAPRRRAAGSVAAYLAPTEPIAALLERRVPSSLVRVVPIGVRIPEKPRRIFERPEDAVALAVSGGARDVPAYTTLLGAISRLLTEVPQIQVFLELHGPNEHEIWREADRLDLLESISVLDLNEHRALLLGSDVLVCPERFGEATSIPIEALAHGIPLVTSDDPYLDLADAGAAVTIVSQDDPAGWAQGLRRVLEDPEGARRAGRAGREWVVERHRVEDQADRLVDTFERMLTGGAVRLTQPPG